MRRLLAAMALLALALTGAASGGHASAARSVSVKRLVDGGHIQITVTFATPVPVGSPLKATFRVRNVSKVTRKLRGLNYPTTAWAVIHSPDGTTYDTRTAERLTGSLGGPHRSPGRLRPGEAVTRTLAYAPRVRWDGPLRITPGWAGTALPTLDVAVTTPSQTPTAASAMADVVASTGHLLDGCTPTQRGVAVRGKLVAPQHSAPTMRVACSVSLHREHGFFRGQVLVVSPPGLSGVSLARPYEELAYLKPGQNATAIAWLFVVTKRGAISIDSTSVDATKNRRRMAPQWQWTTSGFQPTPGGSHCGGWGGGGGGYIGPYIEFVSKCR